VREGQVSEYNFAFKKIQDENYIRLLPANRHWARFKFIIAFVDRRLLNYYSFLKSSPLHQPFKIAILSKESHT
jgi:hypothetical protein